MRITIDIPNESASLDTHPYCHHCNCRTDRDAIPVGDPTKQIPACGHCNMPLDRHNLLELIGGPARVSVRHKTEGMVYHDVVVDLKLTGDHK